MPCEHRSICTECLADFAELRAKIDAHEMELSAIRQRFWQALEERGRELTEARRERDEAKLALESKRRAKEPAPPPLEVPLGVPASPDPESTWIAGAKVEP